MLQNLCFVFQSNSIGSSSDLRVPNSLSPRFREMIPLHFGFLLFVLSLASERLVFDLACILCDVSIFVYVDGYFGLHLTSHVFVSKGEWERRVTQKKCNESTQNWSNLFVTKPHTCIDWFNRHGLELLTYSLSFANICVCAAAAAAAWSTKFEKRTIDQMNGTNERKKCTNKQTENRKQISFYLCYKCGNFLLCLPCRAFLFLLLARCFHSHSTTEKTPNTKHWLLHPANWYTNMPVSNNHKHINLFIRHDTIAFSISIQTL